MKIPVTVTQLLSEVVWTDRKTDMTNWQYDHLMLIIEKMLRIIVTLANHPVVPEVTMISKLSLPLQKQSIA